MLILCLWSPWHTKFLWQPPCWFSRELLQTILYCLNVSLSSRWNWATNVALIFIYDATRISEFIPETFDSSFKWPRISLQKVCWEKPSKVRRSWSYPLLECNPFGLQTHSKMVGSNSIWSRKESLQEKYLLIKTGHFLWPTLYFKYVELLSCQFWLKFLMVVF